MLTDFKNYFTARLGRQVTTKLSLKFKPKVSLRYSLLLTHGVEIRYH